MKYKRGFRILTPGWLDGISLIPFNHCLLSAVDDKTITSLKQGQDFDVIAMVKKSSKVKYGYQGKMLNIEEIYSKTESVVVIQNICFLLK